MSLDTARAERPRQAILLVAGTGSRLRPLTNDRPKCLLQVGDCTLLERLLRQLQEVGVERTVLATGYLHDRLRRAISDFQLSMEIDTVFNETYATENNAVSLGTAMGELGEDRFLLCDGDILLRDVGYLEQLLEFPRDNVLTMMRFPSMGAEEMKIAVDGRDGRIGRLGKGLAPERADGESLGIQKIGPSAFERLADRLSRLGLRERRELYYEDIFAELIDDGVSFYACDLPARGWTEIDTADDLEKARHMASSWRQSG